MKRLALLLAMMAVVPGLPARAASFKAASVPPAALWVCHLDVAGMKLSEAGRQLLARPELKQSPLVAGFSSRFGLDLVKDVRGLTVYTMGTGRLDAVALIDPEPAAAGRLKEWREKTGWKAQTADGLAVFSHAAGNDKLYQAAASGGLLVAAQQLDLARTGVAVAEGRSPALKGESLPALVDRRGGANALFMALARSPRAGLAIPLPQLSLLRNADGLCLAVGERDGRIIGGMTVSAPDEDEALRMEKALDALVQVTSAMAVSQGGSDPLQNVAVEREGGLVRMDGRWSPAEIAVLLGWSGTPGGRRSTKE